MTQPSLPTPNSGLRVFSAVLLSYLMIIMPFAQVAGASQREPGAKSREIVTGSSPAVRDRSSVDQAKFAPENLFVNPPALAPTITASKTDSWDDTATPDGKAEPGQEVTYDVTVANSGTDATGVQFSDTIDANTTLVPGSLTASPLARNDSYVTGVDTVLSVAAGIGVLVNDFGLPAPTAVAITGGATAQGGTVNVNADGSFDYTPPTGFAGTDSFTYTATNGTTPNDTATVTITVDAAPSVTTTTPINGATGVATNTNITINFSENVNATTSSFSIECPAPGNLQTFAVTGSGTNAITLNPNSDLPVGTLCTVTVIANQISDTDTNDPPDNLAANFVFSFTTDAPPTVSGTTPTNGATSVAANSNIVVNFSESVNATISSFTIECPTPGNLQTFAVSGSGTNAITLNPNSDLPAGTTCTVTVIANQISDSDSGDPPDNMAANFVFSFTTDAAPSVTTTSPTNGATIVPANTNIVVNFTENVNVSTSSFTIQCPSPGNLQTFAVSGSGTSAITLDPTANLPEGTTCTVTVVANQVADSDANDPPDNMVANFVFSFTTDTAPSVTSTTPTNGATQVASNTNITINFSENVNIQDATAFTIECPVATPVAFGVTPVAPGATNSFTLDPTTDLPFGTVCTVTVVASKVTDVDAGDPPDNMAANFVFSFTVDSPPAVNSTTPANNATGVVPSTNISITFSEPVNVTGNWFQVVCTAAATPVVTLNPADTVVTGGPTTFTINPNADLPEGVTCTTTVFAAQVADQDSGDPPDNMTANHVFSFKIPPRAVGDARNATGNIRIVTTGRSGFSVFTNDVFPVADPVTITAFDATSVRGGNVSMVTSAGTGTFTYNPPPGYEGADTFNYTITNGAGSSTGTVTITIAGMIWFIDDSASACTTVSAATGCGRLTNPLSTLASFEAVNGNADTPASNIYLPAAGDHIFIYSGNYTAPLTLEANQRVIGQGATTGTLSALSGVTPATDSDALPSTGGANPSITSAGNGFNVVSNNRLYGLTFSNTTGTAINSNANVGTMIFGDIVINNSGANGAGIVLDDGGTSVTTVGTNTITARSGVGLSLTNSTTIGVGGLTFVSISVGNNTADPDPANAIVLNGTGSNGLTVTGDGSQTAGLYDRDGSGGTIQRTTGHSVSLTNANNVTLRKMNITDTTGSGAGCPGACASNMVNSSGGSNIVLSAVLFQNPSGHGWYGLNLGGTSSFDNNSRVQNWQTNNAYGVYIWNTATSFTSFTASNSVFTTSATGAAGFLFDQDTSGGGTVNVISNEFTLIDQNAMQINNDGSGTITAIVQKNNFHDSDATGGDGNNTMFLALSGSGDLNFTIGGPNAADGNTLTNTSRLQALAGIIQVNAAGGSTSIGKLNGSIQNNTITNPGIAGGATRRGIMVQAEASAGNHGAHSVLIANNSVQGLTIQGIFVGITSLNGFDILNTNWTIKNNQVGNLSPVGSGGADGGSAIEFEPNIAVANTDTHFSMNLLVEGNTAVSNNNSAVGTTLEIINRATGGNNTSILNATVRGNSLTQSNGAGEAFELLNSSGTLTTCLDLNSPNTLPNNAIGGGGAGAFRLTNNAGTFNVEGMGASTPSAFLGPRNQTNGASPATITAGGTVGTFGTSAGCADSTAMFTVPQAPTRDYSASNLATENSNAAQLLTATTREVPKSAGPASFSLTPIASALTNSAGESGARITNASAAAPPDMLIPDPSRSPVSSSVAGLRRENSAEARNLEARHSVGESRHRRSTGTSQEPGVRSHHARNMRLETRDLRLDSTRNSNLGTRNSTLKTAAAAPLSGETVNVTIGDMPAGKTVRIVFKVTIDTPYLGGANVSNQGTVSGGNFANVLTDDPSAGGAADPTLTPVVAPPNAGDDAYTAFKNTPLNVPAPGVLGNDTNSPTVSAIGACADATAPFTGCATTAGGTVNVNADGSFTYTPPNATFTGPDSFTYTASNAVGSDTATVNITVADTSAIFINEVLFDPPSADAPNEYIELRGPASGVMPTGTYLVAIEGDAADNPGDVKTIINLSGQSFGSNGYLVLLQMSNTYVPAAGANVLTSTTVGFGGLPGGIWSADASATDLPDASVNFMLIQSGVAPTLTDDIDANNDGGIDGSVYSGWSVRDSVSAMNGSALGRNYSAFGFRNQAGTGTGVGVEVVVPFIPSYVGRICDSTGSTAADWLSSGVLGGSAPNWTLGSSTETEPSSFAGNPLDHIGTTNFVNNAPVNSVPGAQATNEDTALTFNAGNSNLISIADSDAGNNNVQVTLTATNGVVSLSGTAGLSFSFSDGNGTGAGDGTADATMTFRGSVSAINTALNGMTFTPTAGYGGPASVQIITNDLGSTGGTACSSVQTDTDSVSITVNALNSAPSGTDNTKTIAEDTSYIFAAADFGFSDPTDTPPNTLAAVKITTLPAAGALTNNNVAVNAGDFIPVADINGGLLKFTPAANDTGSPYTSFTFQVQDNGGVLNGGVDLDPTPNTFTFNVTGLNDAPAGTDTTVTTGEDTQYTFTAANFGFTDPNDSPANNFQAVTITTLPGLGSLTLSGNPVSAGQSITVGDVNGGNLKFTPVADANGTPYTTFTFQVQDDGGTSGGGVDLDPTPNTMTINVTAANDPPVNTVPGAQGTNQNTPLTFSSGNGNQISVADVDAGTADIQVTLTVTNGTLTLATTAGLNFACGTCAGDGTADATMTFEGTLTEVNTAMNGMTFTPTLGFSGAASLTITSNDLGNSGSGGPLSDTDVVNIQVSTNMNVQDAQVAEPASGTTNMLFTVTLSAPAPSTVTVNYTTADQAPALNHAVGGGACGGAVDYITTAGLLTFTTGQQVKTIAVPICADTNGAEVNETFELNLSGATNATLVDAQGIGTITTTNQPGTLLISELRTSGPAGGDDDFVEIYNNSDSPVTVAATDASAGYGVFKMGADCNATPILVGTIPNGTVIPARGHYLFVGSAYSLANYGGTNAAAGDQTMSSDIENDRNVGLFSTASVANISSANRFDAVGFGTNTGSVCDLFREGTNLLAVNGSVAEYSFFRKQCEWIQGQGCTVSGNPKDTNDNSADFWLADTAATAFPSGIIGVPPSQRLGAPGPENLASPLRRDAGGVIGFVLLDGSVGSASQPNRLRSAAVVTNGAYGTMTLRYRVTNNTGAPVTRLRYRIVDLSTNPAPPGQADLRALTSSLEPAIGPVNDPVTCAAHGTPTTTPCTVAVTATTLEQPPTQPNGGGYNSTLSSGTVTTVTPLAPGASILINFRLGVQQTGTFRFYIIIEALP